MKTNVNDRRRMMARYLSMHKKFMKTHMPTEIYSEKHFLHNAHRITKMMIDHDISAISRAERIESGVSL